MMPAYRANKVLKIDSSGGYETCSSTAFKSRRAPWFRMLPSVGCQSCYDCAKLGLAQRHADIYIYGIVCAANKRRLLCPCSCRRTIKRLSLRLSNLYAKVTRAPWLALATFSLAYDSI